MLIIKLNKFQDKLMKKSYAKDYFTDILIFKFIVLDQQLFKLFALKVTCA